MPQSTVDRAHLRIMRRLHTAGTQLFKKVPITFEMVTDFHTETAIGVSGRGRPMATAGHARAENQGRPTLNKAVRAVGYTESYQGRQGHSWPRIKMLMKRRIDRGIFLHDKFGVPFSAYYQIAK